MFLPTTWWPSYDYMWMTSLFVGNAFVVCVENDGRSYNLGKFCKRYNNLLDKSKLCTNKINASSCDEDRHFVPWWRLEVNLLESWWFGSFTGLQFVTGWVVEQSHKCNFFFSKINLLLASIIILRNRVFFSSREYVSTVFFFLSFFFPLIRHCIISIIIKFSRMWDIYWSKI